MVEQALYDLIGVDYNSTRRADAFLVERLLELMSPQPGAPCLDVGCGTGNYTIALAARADGGAFYGVEPSALMLGEARRKSEAVNWTRGSAEDLPFADESFGAALSTLTIHHWSNLETGFAEIHRVLKKAGVYVIFTAFPEQMETYWLNHYFPQMLKDSIEAMPARRKVEAALNSAGFSVTKIEKYFIRPDLQDLFLYSGKQRPALYLNAEVRKGISSFAVLSRREEVENGLRKLEDDLKSGKFAEIAKSYESDSAGDYCFIAASKLPE